MKQSPSCTDWNWVNVKVVEDNSPNTIGASPPALKLTPNATLNDGGSSSNKAFPSQQQQQPSLELTEVDVDQQQRAESLVREWSETAASPLRDPHHHHPHPSPVYCIPTSTQGPEYFAGRRQDGVRTLLIVMVGLPARGKTFLAQKLCRLLGWHGHKAQVFNVQVIWKHKLREQLALTPDMPLITSAAMFAKLCEESSEVRALYRSVLETIAEMAKAFYHDRGVVIIFNDDFTTSSLRSDVEQILSPSASQTVFVEVQRDSCRNRQFDEMKVMDPEEYPNAGVVATAVGGSAATATTSEVWEASPSASSADNEA